MVGQLLGEVCVIGVLSDNGTNVSTVDVERNEHITGVHGLLILLCLKHPS